MKTEKILAAALLGFSGMLCTAPASAAFQWVFDYASCQGSACGSGAGSPSKTFSGQSGAPGDVTAYAISNTGANTGSGRLLDQASLKRWGGGLGVENAWEDGSSPNHAVDNSGRVDAVLFDFGGKDITLEQIKLGWYSQDSDITVLAYTGSGNPLDNSDPDWYGNSDYGSLLSNGWTYVGDYSNVATRPGGTADINADGYSSSFWLVSAFNPLISSKSWSTGNDYFKIYALAGSAGVPPSGVPEPGVLGLSLLGLGLLAAGRRQRGFPG